MRHESLSVNELTVNRVLGKPFRKLASPPTAIGDATLTFAQMIAGVIEATPTTTSAYTTPTGAVLEAAFVAAGYQLQNDDAWDLTIINLGGTGDDITFTAGASGVSIVGEAIIRPGADAGTDGNAGQGTFRIRRSAPSTFIAYRVA